MKVLLDEMLPVGVADLLADHQVTTAKAADYAGLTNGELIPCWTSTSPRRSLASCGIAATM